MGSSAEVTEVQPAMPSLSGAASLLKLPVETLTSTAPKATVETDLVSLVLKAHPVVQAVMALLAAAIFAVLTIFLFKAVEFALAFALLARDSRAITATTGLLAIIGSVAPFIGLFGTVFGIMNSFLAFAASGNTNLAVVAPGVAEALLATGIGLAAAIPAVMLYNRARRPIVEPNEVKPEPKKKQSASAGSTAPMAAVKLSGGKTVSPAAYAKAVMKKVRATKKTSGAGKGTVVVGFSISRDRDLASVRVLQESGNAALDQIATDHIRRAAPFPPPPDGAGSSYSFEFVGK